MSKKKKKNGKGAKATKAGGTTANKALGAGLLGGVASLAAGQVIKSAVDELVEHGTRRILGRRKAVNKPVEQDLGFVLLHLLCACAEPTPVASLCTKAKAGLVEVLDALQSLRRGRLVAFTQGRRAVTLTSAGRETLEALTASGDDVEPEEKEDGPGREAEERSSDSTAAE